ncbi:MAG: AAA family ATPase [Candidatus Omnitrophica bacterium]|jgi:MoxR-like ATPase|nr:AAA family ATPase [Candidatus Omnitrophota bacterium]
MEEEILKLEEIGNLKKEIISEMHKIIVGQDDALEKMLICLFSGGHCLLIGVPGLAKTLMVKTLSHILDLSFKRIQFTPDLMPSDITGIEVIQENSVSFKRNLEFIPGPVFANLVLSDEINRAPPKTQSALLEAMQEYQVTIRGEIHKIPIPFFVIATQNPIELEGTYPLPEAQLDRFMMSIYLTYPSSNEEKKIASINTIDIEKNIKKILNSEKIISFQSFIKQIPVSDYVLDYTVRLTRNTRPSDTQFTFIKENISWGAGPRACQYLVLAAKTKAALSGQANVSVSDIKDISENIFRHRIFVNFNAEASGINSAEIIKRLIKEVPETL